MPDFALCLKCGKKYDKNAYSSTELNSSKVCCMDLECLGDICRTDAWGYPVAERLREKRYPVFQCCASSSGNAGMVYLVFWGVNLNKQLEVLMPSPIFRNGEDDGTIRQYCFQWSIQASNKAELKRSMLVRREEILNKMELLSPYEGF